MGGFQLPVPTDYGQQNPYAIYGYPGYGGFSPYNGPANSSQNWGTAVGQGGQFVNPDASMEDIFAANRNQISTTGNILGQQAANQLNYYGPLQQQYTAAQNAALNKLQQTPGFTPEEASKIGIDYGQFQTSPDDYAALNSTLQGGVGAEGSMLNSYGSNLGAQLGQYSGNLGGELNNYQSWMGGANTAFGQGVSGATGSGATGVRGAVGGLGSGLESAQGKFSGLDTAVNDPSLGFDPSGTEKQMTDRDVQDLVTSAGTTVGNQFRTAEDTLEREAAASGNMSPAALAAARQNLVTQEAASAGDAMTNARIQAAQAQYQRAAGIEGQRLGASQTQQGMRATASTTEEAAAQAAAAQAGMAGIGGEQFIAGQGLQGALATGQAGMEAANLSGTAGINAANAIGQANLNATNQYGQFSVGQANAMTGQQYNAMAGQQQQRYQQGMGSAQATSQGAQTVGGARQAGEAAYRSGVAGQQGMAQQGGQAAMQAGLGAYGTQTSGITQNAAAQGSFEVGKPSLGDTLGSAAGSLLSSAGSTAARFTGHADGAIITKPETAIVGERGPEMIVPVGRYRPATRDVNALMKERTRKAA